MNPEELLAQIQQLLQQYVEGGGDPAELMALVDQMGQEQPPEGGDAGGMPPDAGGMPPDAGGMPPMPGDQPMPDDIGNMAPDAMPTSSGDRSPFRGASDAALGDIDQLMKKKKNQGY
jgi:hypothetical protein